MEEDASGGTQQSWQPHKPWQSNMQEPTVPAQAQSQPLLSSSTPDRSESRPIRPQSASSSALHSSHSAFTNPEVQQPSNPLYSDSSTTPLRHATDQSNRVTHADSTWVPGALNLRLGANELSQGGIRSAAATNTNTNELRTGQSGLTTGAFELKPDVQGPSNAALLNTQNQQLNLERHTHRADQVGLSLTSSSSSSSVMPV